jgi:EAL domain-containing protein (putative c-di-GMP-specific phosphodiesterase class I)
MRNFPDKSGGEPALCFIVDDEPAIGRFISLALRNFGGVASERFVDLSSMKVALAERTPDLIFLDVSLGSSDAVEAIRHLASVNYRGVVQLISGRDARLLEDVRRIGERRKLKMRSALSKPFRVDAIRLIVEEEKLQFGQTPAAARDGGDDPGGEDARSPKIDLREALEQNWLELWYQPKLDLHRQSLAGAEGLARIRHPRYGVVSPAAFIPGASENDMLDLAEYALCTALRDGVDFVGVGRAFRLAINVPVEALLRLPIATIVRENGPRESDWAGIILEVTEDQVIRDIAAAHEIATQLRIHGIALALDDFGSGYSSLVRLKELPFAELKLDQSFVNKCSLDPTNAALCKMVVDLAHRFGCLAVAEGIETRDDLATIRNTGCDIGQGFLFARPMPKASLLAELAGQGADRFAAAMEPAGGLRASA